RRPDHRQSAYLQRERPPVSCDRVRHEHLRLRPSGENAMKTSPIAVLATALIICLAVTGALAQRRAAPSGPPNPFAGNAQAIGQGEQLYNQNCTACHGINGGAGEIGPEIVHNLSGSLRGELDDNQILDVIRNGTPRTAMPAWKG